MRKTQPGESQKWVKVMIARSLPDHKSPIKIYAKLILDYLWDASLVIAILFGIILLSALTLTLAINYNIITLQQYCHYISQNLPVEGFCK